MNKDKLSRVATILRVMRDMHERIQEGNPKFSVTKLAKEHKLPNGVVLPTVIQRFPFQYDRKTKSWSYTSEFPPNLKMAERVLDEMNKYQSKAKQRKEHDNSLKTVENTISKKTPLVEDEPQPIKSEDFTNHIKGMDPVGRTSVNTTSQWHNGIHWHHTTPKRSRVTTVVKVSVLWGLFKKEKTITE